MVLGDDFASFTIPPCFRCLFLYQFEKTFEWASVCFRSVSSEAGHEQIADLGSSNMGLSVRNCAGHVLRRVLNGEPFFDVLSMWNFTNIRSWHTVNVQDSNKRQTLGQRRPTSNRVIAGDEAMQLAAINARLDSLRGHPGYFDTDSFSSANGSSIFDYAGAGSMSRALPQEMGPGGRSDSISSAPSEGAKKTPNPTPRGETNTRPSTQRSDLESQSSKASKPLSSQKRRASSSGPGTKFRRSNEGDGDSQADVFDPKGEGLPSEGRREAFQQFKARESARKSGPVNESNRSEYLREDARKTGPVDDYLREQRERREAAAKQEEIDKKIRALRTAEVPAVLGADELADLLAQCRQEQEALKQREEMMRRISTPGFEGSAPSVDGSRQKGRSSNGGSSKSSRKSSATNGKVGSGGKEVGSEAGARNPGRKSEQASDVGEFKAEPIGDGLTEERLVTRNKPTSSITELPPAKGAGAAYDMSKGEKRPKSADALFTLPAL